jgi:hypothetical protein
MKYHLDTRPGVNLLLGGGTVGRDGWKNLDLYAPGADVKHDLNKMPLPFKTASVRQIEATNVLEHIASWDKVVTDCAYLAAIGGDLEKVYNHLVGD